MGGYEIGLAGIWAGVILRQEKEQKREQSMPIKRDKFDFEIGYLGESPCRGCVYRKNLPHCSDKCRLMDDIRIVLARAISCSGTYNTQ